MCDNVPFPTQKFKQTFAFGEVEGWGMGGRYKGEGRFNIREQSSIIFLISSQIEGCWGRLTRDYLAHSSIPLPQGSSTKCYSRRSICTLKLAHLKENEKQKSCTCQRLLTKWQMLLLYTPSMPPYLLVTYRTLICLSPWRNAYTLMEGRAEN